MIFLLVINVLPFFLVKIIKYRKNPKIPLKQGSLYSVVDAGIKFSASSTMLDLQTRKGLSAP